MKGPVVVLVLLCIHSCVGLNPVSNALNFETVAHRNTHHTIELRANVELPDNNELNWPIHVPHELTVEDARVEIQHLYHEDVRDLRISLVHGGTRVYLTNYTGGERMLGRPNVPEYPTPGEVRVGGSAAPGPIEGWGSTYRWADVGGLNLARDRNATQSTTLYGGNASRANDGDVSGHYNDMTVTHTGGHGFLDYEPWWEVEVSDPINGNASRLGTIRLWNRVIEPNIDEVQVIRTTASNTIRGGFFYVSLTFRGETDTTHAIYYNAVAEIKDEDQSSRDPGTGGGGSMQAKLQALTNVNQVSVRRTGSTTSGGHEWHVTFRGDPGDIPQLVFVNESLVTDVPVVTIETARNGNANVWYNYKGDMEEIEGRLFPCYVMVSDEKIGNATLDEALNMSSWNVYLEDEERETTLTLPDNTVGSWVRIQLVDDDYMSIAEVQVYEKQGVPFSEYKSGSPIIAGTYQPEYSLDEGFSGADSTGTWLLSIYDTVPREVLYTTQSRPIRMIHGNGGLSSWALELDLSDGNTYRYEADMMTRIDTLPFYGTLYANNITSTYVNGTNSTRGEEIPTAVGFGKYRSKCLDDGCRGSFGIGNNFDGDSDGAKADETNRQTVVENLRSVIYVPPEGWTGIDYFTYRVFLGVDESERARATIHVRNCRLDCANEYFEDRVEVRSDARN